MGYIVQGIVVVFGIVNCLKIFIQEKVINMDNGNEIDVLYL